MKISLKSKSSDNCNTLFSSNLPYVQIVIILLLGIISYANTLDATLNFDDYPIIRFSKDTCNNLFCMEGFIHKTRWFTDATFLLNRLLHEEQVLGYHLFNLIIHLSSAVVIYLFIWRAIEALKLNYKISVNDDYQFLQRLIPFSAAALFVCHPVQTQAVTYISQRYTSLATILYLGSLLSYLQARLSDEVKKIYKWLWSFLFFLLALLAMKSKEIAFTLPLMAVMLEFALFRGKLLKNRLVLALGAGLLLLIPLQLIYMDGTLSHENLLTHIQAATAETQTISRTDYFITQFRVVATYLRLLILPVNQNMDYDYPIYHSIFIPEVFVSLLLHITLLVLALVLFIRSERQLASGNQTAGISMRISSLGIFWFYLAMSVESGLIPITDVIFEHRIYLPSVGFFMASASFIAGIAAYRQRYRNVLQASIVLLCLVLTASTFARNRKWSDELILWQDVVEKSPNKARARFAVGSIFCRRLLPEKALPYLVRALEFDALQDKYLITLNTVILQLGRYKGRFSVGKEYYTPFDTVDPGYRMPWLAISYNNLGLAYEHLGNLYMARKNYLKAIAVNPFLDLAWINLALVAARQKDTATVESSLKKLVTFNPHMDMYVAK